MPTIDVLEPLLAAPAQALNVEHKCWLDLRDNDEHKRSWRRRRSHSPARAGGVIVIGLQRAEPNAVIADGNMAEPRQPPQIDQQARGG